MFNLERAGSRHLKFYADCSELHELEFKELRRIIKHLFNSSHDSDQMSELKIFDIYLYFGTETPKNLSDVNRMKTEIAEYITKFSLKLGVPKSNLRINFQRILYQEHDAFSDNLVKAQGDVSVIKYQQAWQITQYLSGHHQNRIHYKKFNDVALFLFINAETSPPPPLFLAQNEASTYNYMKIDRTHFGVVNANDSVLLKNIIGSTLFDFFELRELENLQETLQKIAISSYNSIIIDYF